MTFHTVSYTVQQGCTPFLSNVRHKGIKQHKQKNKCSTVCKHAGGIVTFVALTTLYGLVTVHSTLLHCV